MTSNNIDRPIFSHSAGKTLVTYSPDGHFIYTAGADNFIRKHIHNSDDEPQVIDGAPDDNTGLCASNKHIITSSEDCTVSCFSASKASFDKLLVRTTLAARDVALSPDGLWVAVASDDTVVKVVNVDNPTHTATLREQTSGNKHVSFHPSGSYLAVSCTNGAIYVYSLTSEEPQFLKKVDGVIKRVNEPRSEEASTKVAWCPDGRAFAAPTPTGDIVIIDREGWARHKSFANGHGGSEITDFAWCPNGAFLASAGKDGKVLIWESRTQNVVAKFDAKDVICVAWHPKENEISYTTNNGRFNTIKNAIPEDKVTALKLATRPAPLNNDISIPSITQVPVGRPRPREYSPDPVDDILGLDDDDEDFIVDDDGAGYAEPNLNGKRPAIGPIGAAGAAGSAKRPALGFLRPEIHESFQPSSTPWRGEPGRRYLCVNLIGYVWTLDQGTHNTVTVEFYDRETYRPFHFTDTFLYDKACLNDHGTLFACQPSDAGDPAMLFYRPHETWTKRTEWRTLLPDGEEIVSVAMSESYIVVCTSNGYVRVYTLFGIPIHVYRQKHQPAVACASFRDYVLVLGNGPVGADGKTQLTYTLENIKRDETLQNSDVVALPPGGQVKNVFFSEEGDPMIYDSDGVLLVLQHWREVSQARWVPLLDTRQLGRLQDGERKENYWAVAAGRDHFHCIILKNGEQYPYFPKPMLSEFPYHIPISGAPAPASSEEASITDSDSLEQTVVRESILYSLASDAAGSRVLDAEDRASLAKKESSIDRALLQLLMMVCKEGEESGGKALEICGLFRNQQRSLDLAVKIAVKMERMVLAGKIKGLKESLEEEEEGMEVDED